MTEVTVTALEPAWVEVEHKLDNNGGINRVENSEKIVHSDGMDQLFESAKYTTSDGETFESWDEAISHLHELDQPE